MARVNCSTASTSAERASDRCPALPPQLHQEVRVNWHDFPDFETAVHPVDLQIAMRAGVLATAARSNRSTRPGAAAVGMFLRLRAA